LANSYASNNEVETGFILAVKLEFLPENEVEKLFQMIEEEAKMLSSLISKLNNNIK